MSMPFSANARSQVIGIDAGATLCKLAYIHGKMIATHTIPSGDFARIRDYIAARAPVRTVAAGGGAVALAADLPELEIDVAREFEAWALGAPVLARRDGIDLPERYLLVSLGTGTSILRIEQGRSAPIRVGGCALGGGTLLGLGELLLGTKSFQELVACSLRGDRSRVDLLVGDIYGGADTPLPRELNASSFAKLSSREPHDLAHALMGMIGENVALLCGQLIRAQNLAGALYCGSTLTDNPVLRQVLQAVAELQGQRAWFLELGAFCGAVGAAVMAADRCDERGE